MKDGLKRQPDRSYGKRDARLCTRPDAMARRQPSECNQIISNKRLDVNHKSPDSGEHQLKLRTNHRRCDATLRVGVEGHTRRLRQGMPGGFSKTVSCDPDHQPSEKDQISCF